MDTSTLLRVALTARGITAGQFAQSLDPPVSEGMIYKVASGRRSSARVEAAIRRLINDELKRLPRGIASAA
jgi:hypothetical protein